MSTEPKPLADTDLDQVSGGTFIAKMTSSLTFIPASPSTTTTPTLPPASPTVQGGSTTSTTPVTFK